MRATSPKSAVPQLRTITYPAFSQPRAGTPPHHSSMVLPSTKFPQIMEKKNKRKKLKKKKKQHKTHPSTWGNPHWILTPQILPDPQGGNPANPNRGVHFPL